MTKNDLTGRWSYRKHRRFLRHPITVIYVEYRKRRKFRSLTGKIVERTEEGWRVASPADLVSIGFPSRVLADTMQSLEQTNRG
jgi:hypothetical protein